MTDVFVCSGLSVYAFLFPTEAKSVYVLLCGTESMCLTGRKLMKPLSVCVCVCVCVCVMRHRTISGAAAVKDPCFTKNGQRPPQKEGGNAVRVVKIY